MAEHVCIYINGVCATCRESIWIPAGPATQELSLLR